MIQGASMRRDRNTTEGVAAVKKHAIGVLQSLGARLWGEVGGDQVGVSGRKRARCDEGVSKGGRNVRNARDDEGVQEGTKKRVMDGGDEGLEDGSQHCVSCADFEPTEQETFGKVRN